MKYLCHQFGTSADICPFIHVPRRNFPCILTVWRALCSQCWLKQQGSALCWAAQWCAHSPVALPRQCKAPMAQVQDATTVLMLLHDTSLACSSWHQAGVCTVILCGALVWKCPNTGSWRALLWMGGWMGQWLILLTPEHSTRGFAPEIESGHFTWEWSWWPQRLIKVKPQLSCSWKIHKKQLMWFFGKEALCCYWGMGLKQKTVLELPQVSSVALQSSLGLFILWSPTCKLG